MVHVHMLVLQAFRGARPRGAQARHLNGDPADNRLVNLRWGTVRENMADRERHGRTARAERNGSNVYRGKRPRGMRHALVLNPESRSPGERNGSAKLTEKQVLQIRERLAQGDSCNLIAVEYGVDRLTISNIKRRKNWAHLDGGPAPFTHNQRLSDVQVLEMRALLARGFTLTELARRYRVTVSYVGEIKKGRKRKRALAI